MELDQKYILDLAKEILMIDSPSGFTANCAARIMEEARKFGLEPYQSKKGNVLIEIPGREATRLGVTVHIDTLGYMVRSISNEGLKITNIGGPQVATTDGEYCKIYTRTGKVYTGTILNNSPSSHVYPDAAKERKIDNMYVRIDEQVKTVDEIKALGISNGDYVCYDPKTTVTESGFVKSRFLDDKINVASVFGFIKYLKDNNLTPKQNLTFIFSTFEEVGHGSSAIPELDELLAIDMGCIGLDLACTEYDVSICAKDSSGPYNYEMTTKLIELAKENGLKYAVDIYPMYGSDASAAVRGGNDVKTALMGPGVHASHGMERTHISGILNTIKLLALYTK